MSEFSISIDEGGILQLTTDVNGAIARALEFEAANTVEWDVKDAINVPAQFTVTRRGFKVYTPNPPEGPPRERTGDMWASVSHDRPTNRGREGLHVDVTVHGSHYNFDYPGWLIDKGYIFVNRGNPRYVIVDR